MGKIRSALQRIGQVLLGLCRLRDRDSSISTVTAVDPVFLSSVYPTALTSPSPAKCSEIRAISTGQRAKAAALRRGPDIGSDRLLEDLIGSQPKPTGSPSSESCESKLDLNNCVDCRIFNCEFHVRLLVATCTFIDRDHLYRWLAESYGLEDGQLEDLDKLGRCWHNKKLFEIKG